LVRGARRSADGPEEPEMNIALIGGVERREAELERIARHAGHRLECHGGHVGGRGADALRAVIERADVVVIQTFVNSHGSMYLAKRVARQLGKILLVVRTCGPARLEALCDDLQPRRHGAINRCA